MKAILDVLDFIVSTIKTLWDFFIGLIRNSGTMIKYLGIALRICNSAIASMPTWIQAFGTLTITICILFVILGRDTGGKKSG